MHALQSLLLVAMVVHYGESVIAGDFEAKASAYNAAFEDLLQISNQDTADSEKISDTVSDAWERIGSAQDLAWEKFLEASTVMGSDDAPASSADKSKGVHEHDARLAQEAEESSRFYEEKDSSGDMLWSYSDDVGSQSLGREQLQCKKNVCHETLASRRSSAESYVTLKMRTAANNLTNAGFTWIHRPAITWGQSGSFTARSEQCGLGVTSMQ